MSGFNYNTGETNPMLALAEPRVDKRGWLEQPAAKKKYVNDDIWKILMDNRLKKNDWSGVKVQPSDVDKWSVEKKQAFLETTVSYIDGFDFSIPYDKRYQDDFNVAMAMAGKATVVLDTCLMEDIWCGTNMRRYPMTEGINSDSKLFEIISKWRDDVLKTVDMYLNANKSNNVEPRMPAPPQYTYWYGYDNALQKSNIPIHMQRGGKRTKNKRGKKTKRTNKKTRRKRKRR